MIDTHSHIYGPEFDADRAEVISRARAAGVSRILLPNINRDSVAPMLALCAEYPDMVRPMMGLHPEDVREDWPETLDWMRGLLAADGRYIAVGEVGLDFYWDDKYRREQLDAFDAQVGWAAELDLPLVIHCRSAHREMVDVLRARRAEGLRGVFHCFSSSAEVARELLSFPGFVLGIGGVLTFKNCKLPAVVRDVPIERMVVETDAPYLAPAPNRGKRNEPAYVADTLMRLAQEKGLTLQQAEAATDAAARLIFGEI